MATNPRSTSPASVAASTSAIERDRHQLALGEVGLGEQRLLGEGAERAEEADAERGQVARTIEMKCQVEVTTGQDSDVDEAALRRSARRCALRRSSIPTTPSPCSAACRSPTSASPRVDHHRALRQGLAEAVYGPGKTARAVRRHRRRAARQAAPRPCCSPAPTTSRSSAVLAANPGAPAHGRHGRVAARRRRAPRAGRSSSPPAPPTCPSPTSAPPCSRPTASTPMRITDVGVAGVHRLLAARRRAGRGRRRRGRRRHGGRAGQPGRRPHACAGRRGADQRRLRRRPRGRHRAARRCSRRAPRASPSSASTTASARPAPRCACARCTTDRDPTLT